MIEDTRDRDSGFTLIELMVVVLIIAILLAIAIPTYLGAQARAQDRAAQSEVRNALTASKVLAADQEGRFLNASGMGLAAADMFRAEASLSFVDAVPTAGRAIGVLATDIGPGPGTALALMRLSASGTMFGIFATTTGRLHYCRNPGGNTSTWADAANCTGDKW